MAPTGSRQDANLSTLASVGASGVDQAVVGRGLLDDLNHRRNRDQISHTGEPAWRSDSDLPLESHGDGLRCRVETLVAKVATHGGGELEGDRLEQAQRAIKQREFNRITPLCPGEAERAINDLIALSSNRRRGQHEPGDASKPTTATTPARPAAASQLPSNPTASHTLHQCFSNDSQKMSYFLNKFN